MRFIPITIATLALAYSCHAQGLEKDVNAIATSGSFDSTLKQIKPAPSQPKARRSEELLATTLEHLSARDVQKRAANPKAPAPAPAKAPAPAPAKTPAKAVANGTIGKRPRPKTPPTRKASNSPANPALNAKYGVKVKGDKGRPTTKAKGSGVKVKAGKAAAMAHKAGKRDVTLPVIKGRLARYI